MKDNQVVIVGRPASSCHPLADGCGHLQPPQAAEVSHNDLHQAHTKKETPTA